MVPQRPDGTIQYAENPPKKYQDIYPFDFETEHWRELWEELKSVVQFWVDQGVRIFRVDNPHTKPFPFWEWLIAEIKRDCPEAIFLAEAFTRPKVLQRLAKLGFTQSYNYFPWRNTKWELTQYLTELTQTEVSEYLGPNLWPNTPDILPEYLQYGGRPALIARLVLAATLGPSYGIYGPVFELCENKPSRPAREEYLDSEKYEIRTWDLDRPDSLRGLIARVNQIRRDNPAFRANHNLRFHEVDNEQIIAYSKKSVDGVERSAGRGQPRSALQAVRLHHAAAGRPGARPAAAVPGPRSADRRALSVAWRAQLRGAGPRRRAGAHLRHPAQGAHRARLRLLSVAGGLRGAPRSITLRCECPTGRRFSPLPGPAP